MKLTQQVLMLRREVGLLKSYRNCEWKEIKWDNFDSSELREKIMSVEEIVSYLFQHPASWKEHIICRVALCMAVCDTHDTTRMFLQTLDERTECVFMMWKFH